MSNDEKLGFKVTLKPESRFANVGAPSNRTGFIGLVYEIDDFGPENLWYRVIWETREINSYKEEDLLWYDYVDDWKDVVRSWGGIVVE